MQLHVSLKQDRPSITVGPKDRHAFEMTRHAVTELHNFETYFTLTSGQEVEVKSQSGHLKVLGSKCALLWFSMSERPWKDSMQIRQENLLALRLGELTAEGEAGASLLSCQKKKKTSQ